MRDTLVKLRRRISSENKFNEDFLKDIKEVPTYDLFTPDKVAVECEDGEISDNFVNAYFLERICNDSERCVFLLDIKEKEISEIKPSLLHLRYNISDPDIPHYPGGDFTATVENYNVIRNEAGLLKHNANHINFENFPALEVEVKIESKSKYF